MVMANPFTFATKRFSQDNPYRLESTRDRSGRTDSRNAQGRAERLERWLHLSVAVLLSVSA